MVEDGREYSELCTRFGADLATWSRVDCGHSALAVVQRGEVDALLLDLCFRRLCRSRWLAPLPGDEVWVRDVGREQGIVILQHLRVVAPTIPVVLAMDPSRDPSRWPALSQRYAPVEPLGARLHPAAVVASLGSMIRPKP